MAEINSILDHLTGVAPKQWRPTGPGMVPPGAGPAWADYAAGVTEASPNQPSIADIKRNMQFQKTLGTTPQANAWDYGPARGAMPAGATPVAPPTGQGALYKGGKILGKAVGRAGAPLALASMGFGMADKVAEIQADPNERSWVERGLQVASGADVFGTGKGIANMIDAYQPFGWTAQGREPIPGAAPWYSGSGGALPSARPPEGAGLAQDQNQAAQMGAVRAKNEADVNARIAAAVDEANTKSMWGAVEKYRAGQVPQMAPSYDSYYAAQARQGATPSAGFGAAPNRTVMVGNTPVDTSSSYDGSMGRFFGAMLNQKRAAATRAENLAKMKLNYDYTTKVPGMAKDATMAAMQQERLRLAGLEPNPEKRAAYIGGHALPAPETFTAPLGAQPMTQDAKNPTVNVIGSRTGAIRAMPVTRAPVMATREQFRVDVEKHGRARAMELYKERNITPPKE